MIRISHSQIPSRARMDGLPACHGRTKLVLTYHLKVWGKSRLVYAGAAGLDSETWDRTNPQSHGLLTQAPHGHENGKSPAGRLLRSQVPHRATL